MLVMTEGHVEGWLRVSRNQCADLCISEIIVAPLSTPEVQEVPAEAVIKWSAEVTLKQLGEETARPHKHVKVLNSRHKSRPGERSSKSY
ncbi:hypothetical protein B296_00040585 [Ensete ventricosum]|uniref:Uncharacterized protein n=1 Tax=Ensete ventricosum TaxID=4639 RepID=A0A426YIG8_ENSVE|nr:hypothetical protein B296_00040585 [Ensete ventricosum]